MQSNAMVMKRTIPCAPYVAKNRIHLRGIRHYGSRCNIPGPLKMNGICIQGRLHVQGIIFGPLPHHSNAHPVQGTMSFQLELREMDELREVPQLFSQPSALLFKSLRHASNC
jgi:hypothetical protein